MRSRTLVVTACLICLGVTGCGAPGPTSMGAREKAEAVSLAHLAVGNRAAALSEAAHLVTLVSVPGDAVPVPHALGLFVRNPAELAVASQPRAEVVHYWRVPRSSGSVYLWLSGHPPRGLQVAQPASSGPGIEGEEYDATVPHPPQTNPSYVMLPDAAVVVEVEPLGPRSSEVRAAAESAWFNPSPMADNSKGRRLRMSVTRGCPADDRGVVGVSNPGAGLPTSLLPPGRRPSRALLCLFGWDSRLLRHIVVPGAVASRLAAALSSAPIAQTEISLVGYGCPAQFAPVPEAAVLFAYPGSADVATWVQPVCDGMTSNGFVMTATPTSASRLIQRYEVGLRATPG
jgi:hypothetical protein